MKSSKSLFNPTLFKSNIKRFLPFSILFLIVELMIYPLIIYTTHFRNGTSRIDFDELATMGIASNVFAGIFAGVFAILVFSYLFTSNKCNAIHAFPIGRKALFTTNLLSAYALLVAPQLIGFGLAIPGIAINANGAVLKSALLFQLSTIFLFSFIAISIGVLAMMLSGNAFSGAVIYLILNFIYAAFVLLVNWAVTIFGYGITDTLSGLEKNSFFLSPAVNLFINAANYDDANKYFVSATFYKALIIYFVVSIALCFIAFLLYKLRELEVAGEMVAFEAEIPFIRIIVSIIGGAVFSMGVGSVLSAGRVGYAVLYAVFSFIIYFATQMILKKKFNIFSVKLIVRWVICCALSLGFILSLAACETNYIPASDKTESAVFNATYAVNADSENTAQIRELHKELIEYSKAGKAPSDEYEYEAPVDENYLSITLNYHLKNGKAVEREYLYDIGSSKKIDSLIDGIEAKKDYESIFDYLDSLDSKYTINSIIINDYTGSEEIVLDSKNFDEFIGLCKEDIITLTKDYSSTKRSEFMGAENEFDICLSGTISDAKELEKIPERTYGNSFIEGFFSYYESYNDTANNKKSYELEIHLNTFPKDSKALKFAQEHHKN